MSHCQDKNFVQNLDDIILYTAPAKYDHPITCKNWKSLSNSEVILYKNLKTWKKSIFVTMATSMAATLAASLPVHQATTPALPQSSRETIPPSMSKLIDVEADIPISVVQLDGLVRLDKF